MFVWLINIYFFDMIPPSLETYLNNRLWLTIYYLCCLAITSLLMAFEENYSVKIYTTKESQLNKWLYSKYSVHNKHNKGSHVNKS